MAGQSTSINLINFNITTNVLALRKAGSSLIVKMYLSCVMNEAIEIFSCVEKPQIGNFPEIEKIYYEIQRILRITELDQFKDLVCDLVVRWFICTLVVRWFICTVEQKRLSDRILIFFVT